MRKALALSFSAQIIAALAVLLLNVLVARTFGPEGTGLLFELLMFVMVASVIARIGMDNVLTRHVSVAYANNDFWLTSQILRVASRAGLIAAGVAVVLTITVYWVWKGSLGIKVLVLFSIPFIVLTALYSSGLRGMGKAWAYPLLGQAVMPIFVSLSILLYWALDIKASIDQLFPHYVLGAFIAFLLARWMWNSGVARLASQPPNASEKQEMTCNKLWTSCQHLFPVSVLNLAVFPWAGILFLSVYGSTLADVGIYAVVERLASQIRWIVTSVGSVVAPKLSVLHKQGENLELVRLVRKSSMLITIMVLPIIASLYFFDESILLAFGEEFVKGAPVLDILLIGGLVNAITSNAGILLMMTGYEKETKHALYASALSLLLCMWVLIPFLGVTGAAISYSLAIILQNGLLAYFVNKRLEINMMPRLGGLK